MLSATTPSVLGVQVGLDSSAPAARPTLEHVRVRLEVGNRPYDVTVRQGKIANFGPATAPGKTDVRIAGPATAWTSGFVARGLTVEGDPITQTAPYRGAILRLIALMREANGAHDQQMATIKDVERQFDTAVGRYVYVRIQGVQYRVYYEEAGQGIPMVLQHTAGSDGRQWRHLLEDTDIQKRYRLIAYDLPFHGKSVPPLTVRWWEKEYRLTRDGVMDSIVQRSAHGSPQSSGCSRRPADSGLSRSSAGPTRAADTRAELGLRHVVKPAELT